MAKRTLWSLSGLANETGRNFRTVAKALEGVRPDGKNAAGKPLWCMATAIQALDEHKRRTGRVSTRTAPERFDPEVERWIGEIEATGAAVDGFLGRLRAMPSAEARRKLVENGGGRCVGAYERALVTSIGHGASAPLRRVFIDSMMDNVMSKVLALCEWRLDETERAA
jgi:hypothetical protein